MGIGVDIVDTGRLSAALGRTPQLAARLFTGTELGRPAQSLAACFAAKEALAKALGAPPGLLWTDAEIRHTPEGRPVIVARGTVAAAATRLGVRRWHLSLTHDRQLSVAMVVAEG